MRTKQLSALIIAVGALSALGWSLRAKRAYEGDASPALARGHGGSVAPRSAPEVTQLEVGPVRGADRDAVGLDGRGPTMEDEGDAVRVGGGADRSAAARWEAEYAGHTEQQLDEERKALLGQVARQKHAVGLEKLNKGEGVILARGAQPDDEAFATGPGAMSVFRAGSDGTDSTIWERVDLYEVDHPELFELDAKMRWVNKEWAQRRDASSGIPTGSSK